MAAQKIPPELVWVAEVESSFDPRAESPAAAAGLFQLRPETAKRFGLSLWPRDQRFQTQASATDSARYLQYPVGYSYGAQNRMTTMTNWSNFAMGAGPQVTTWCHQVHATTAHNRKGRGHLSRPQQRRSQGG
jgi:hypothetical protein